MIRIAINTLWKRTPSKNYLADVVICGSRRFSNDILVKICIHPSIIAPQRKFCSSVGEPTIPHKDIDHELVKRRKVLELEVNDFVMIFMKIRKNSQISFRFDRLVAIWKMETGRHNYRF